MDFSLGSMLGIKKKPVPPTTPETDPLASVKASQAARAKMGAEYGPAPSPAIATPDPMPPAPSPVQPAVTTTPTTVPGVIDAIKANRDAVRSAAGMKDGGIVEKELLRRKAAVNQKRGC
ncbi:MAG: hypothetical protein IPL32_17725 [Chloracidobacterium sp.]|nr:hypothetical protein [Chloracidobacterium sp.]